MGYTSGTKDTANVADSSSNVFRRKYGMTDEIKELWPSETPFLTFSSNMRREPTDDPEPRKMVHRSGWVDRRFFAAGAGAWSSAANAASIDGGVSVDNGSAANVGFLVAGLVCRAKTTGGDTVFFINNVVSQKHIDAISISASPNAIADNDEIQVIGTTFTRGADKATATYDVVDYEATATQIFKTTIDVTGTLAATGLYGGSEYDRLSADKFKEHKTDIERALLFSAYAASGTADAASAVYWTTYGIVTFIEDNSTTSNIFSREYNSYVFDEFIDDMEDWFTKGGNRATNEKLFLSGSSVVGFFSKIADGKLWADAQINIDSSQSSFGVDVQVIKHPFGTLNLVHEPLFRGDSTNTFYKDYACGVDMMNYSYRPLEGNGISRDTHLIEGLQTTYDKIIDQYLTEAAGHPTMAETHALFKMS
jgi:hypothetical protein